MANLNTYSDLFEKILAVIQNNRQEAIKKLHQALVNMYWEIGYYILTHIQKNKKAGYGEEIIKRLSHDLKESSERGFSIATLKNIRQFYLTYPQLNLIRPGIKWSHYLALMRLPTENSRRFYEEMILKEGWSAKECSHQIQTSLYKRVIAKQIKTTSKPTLLKPPKIEETIKDPYILDFLQLEDGNFQESDLEQAIISNIEEFLLELGYGFSFVARQKRIQVGNQFYYVDLVFFHRGLLRIILIDLKIGKFTPADAGQMNLYRNYFRENERYEWEKEPIGIVLCTDKEDETVHYALGDISKHIFVSRYKTFLPSEASLKQRLTTTKQQFYQHNTINEKLSKLNHPRKEIILNHFKKEPRLVLKEYQKLAKISRATAHRDLANGVKEGWLRRCGKTRAAYYILQNE